MTAVTTLPKSSPASSAQPGDDLKTTHNEPTTTTSAPPPIRDLAKSYTHRLLSISDSLLSSLSTLSFPPAISAARMAIVSMMSHSITFGQIRILTADQGVYVFPNADKRKELGLGDVPTTDIADIRVIRDTFWFRLVVLAELGFAEAYMAGDCEVSDLVQVFKVSPPSRTSLTHYSC